MSIDKSIISNTKFTTNENGESNLESKLNDYLKDTEFFDVLVGYFYTSGFYKIYKSLENVKEIKILIGISTDYRTYSLMEEAKSTELRLNDEKTKKLFSEKLIDEMNFSEDSLHVEEGILKFIDWLQNGKLKIKTYPFDRIHAKLYIMTYDKNSQDRNKIITGSSNLTASGLNNNLEFNVELRDPVDYEFAKYKFDELWKNAIDISEEYIETIKRDTWLNENITPYELYLKFIYEYLKNKINADQEQIDIFIPDGFLDLQYQKDAVIDAKSKLDEYNGVFLSDVVGIGKTYISALLAQQLPGKTLVIAPPVLLKESNSGSWPNVFREFGVRRYRCESWGKLDTLIEEGIDDYKNVFIDESHLFRNVKTQRYSKLARICRGKKVILVSATPLNNRPSDILAQLSLFQSPEASDIPDKPNLRAYFNGLEKRLKGVDRQENEDEYLRIVKENAERIRNDVLQYVMVRRTRRNIEKYYSKDLEEQGLTFLEVNDPRPELYNFDKNLNEIFLDTLNKIGNELTYARYTPLLYLIEEDPELKAPQSNMGGFMKKLLLKRLESSFYAFKQSIKRFIYSYEKFIEAYENGYVYFSKNKMNRVFELLDDEDEEGIQELLDSQKADRIESSKFTSTLAKNLNHDLNILKEIKDMWQDLDNDPKINQLIYALIHDETLQNKIIIFTESQETAEYITKQLNPLFDNKVLCFTGDSNDSLRRRVINNFDANARKKEDQYRILVTTDVLAEGVNLHRSNVVMNYDIPWNPTKMMQRVGRIQRVGSEFNEVYIYNFFPTDQINENIGLKEAAVAKIGAFIEMLGNDSKLLTDEEIKAPELFEKLNSRKTFDEDEEENTELEYLEIMRDIRDNNKALYEKIKKVPKKARAGKMSNENGLLTFFRKGHSRKIYFNNGKEIKEIDFFTAAELLKCDAKTKGVKLNKDFYDLLYENKCEFENSSKQDYAKVTNKKGGSIELTLMNIIKSIQGSSEFTDEDEEFLIDVLNALEIGVVPDYDCKKSHEAMKDLNPLTILHAFKANIPQEHLYNKLSAKKSSSEVKEVILSEYLIGE